MLQLFSGIPTILTLFRLFFSFFFTPALYYFLSPVTSPTNLFLALIFALVSLTDFLDGYLARSWGQESIVGRLLDPIADKIWVMGPLIVLTALNKIDPFWVFILLTREIVVMAIRSFCLEFQKTVPVSGAGKIKTALQYSYITFALAGSWDPVMSPVLYWSEHLLLACAVILSVWSGVRYTLQAVSLMSAVRN